MPVAEIPLLVETEDRNPDIGKILDGEAGKGDRINESSPANKAPNKI